MKLGPATNAENFILQLGILKVERRFCAARLVIMDATGRIYNYCVQVALNFAMNSELPVI